jgi:hypothetical protein
MVVPLLTTTFRRRALSTWRCVSGKACRSSSRPSLARRLVLGRTTASPTSLPLEQPSRDKSPPRTTSPAPTSAWAQASGSGEATNACREANLHVTRGQQLAVMQAACPAGALNANLTSRAAITSPSTSALPHAKLRPRHSSTLYDMHRPRLRLTHGKTSKYLGRLRQAQTTRGEGQAS